MNLEIKENEFFIKDIEDSIKNVIKNNEKSSTEKYMNYTFSDLLLYKKILFELNIDKILVGNFIKNFTPIFFQNVFNGCEVELDNNKYDTHSITHNLKNEIMIMFKKLPGFTKECFKGNAFYVSEMSNNYMIWNQIEINKFTANMNMEDNDIIHIN